jgi:protein ImuA
MTEFAASNLDALALVHSLRQQMEELVVDRRSSEVHHHISSGFKDLDNILPGRGFRRGTLVEWLAASDGAGAQTLALRSVHAACRAEGAWVVLDRRHEFYPLAALSAGLDLDRLILVRPDNESDHDWALDQALRCPAVDAVLGWATTLDPHTFRRLQLAAEEGGTLGLLIRPAQVRQEPSWAEVRLLVEPRPGTDRWAKRRLRIHLLRCRGGAGGRWLDRELDDETNTMRSTVGQQPARRQEGA